MYQPIITALLPIFLIIGLGYTLRTSRFLPVEFFPSLNRLAFYIGLPVLLFSRIATSTLEGGPALRVFWVIMIAMALVTLTAFPLAKKMKLERPGQGAFVQAALRGNLSYIGLSVILYSLAAVLLITSS